MELGTIFWVMGTKSTSNRWGGGFWSPRLSLQTPASDRVNFVKSKEVVRYMERALFCVLCVVVPYIAVWCTPVLEYWCTGIYALCSPVCTFFLVTTVHGVLVVGYVDQSGAWVVVVRYIEQSGVLVYLSTGVLVYWCTWVLVVGYMEQFGVLEFWCTCTWVVVVGYMKQSGVLVCWCSGVLE